jgi:hypothetical protein
MKKKLKNLNVRKPQLEKTSDSAFPDPRGG